MSRSEDASHASFFIAGAMWILEFCLTFIFTIAKQDLGESALSYDIFIGIIHAVILLVAAYEDLKYGTNHLMWIIILSVVMNYLMGFLATLGIVALLVGVVVCCICAYFGSAGLSAVLLYSALGGSISGIIAALFFVGTIISSMIVMNSAW